MDCEKFSLVIITLDYQWGIAMKFYSIFVTTTVMVSALALSACASGGMDNGDLISQRGGDISARGKSWADGQRDQREGQKLVSRSDKQVSDGEKALRKAQDDMAKAQRRIEDASNDRVNGERLVTSGNLKMQQAESDYSTIRQGPSAVQ